MACNGNGEWTNRDGQKVGGYQSDPSEIVDCTYSNEDAIKYCNFKTDGFCGWQEFPFNRQIRDWTITGTSGTTGNGLRFKSTKSYKGHTSAIFSPVYPHAYLSNSTCFFFKMLMNGSGMGSLDVYILPEDNANFEVQTPLATFTGNQVLT